MRQYEKHIGWPRKGLADVFLRRKETASDNAEGGAMCPRRRPDKTVCLLHKRNGYPDFIIILAILQIDQAFITLYDALNDS